MATTIRQQIIDAIDARMKTILVANGYETDVGANVSDWKANALEESDLPALVYQDILCETEINNFNVFIHRMTIDVQVVVSDSTPMATIRKIIADIDKAIGVGQDWGNLALLTERISDESKVEIQEKTFAGCTITIVVTFRTQGWDDYTTI